MKFFQTLTNTINPFIFLLSFCVGIFFTYIFTSNPDIIYINPNPHNQDVVYKDDSDKCFRYTAENVKCTEDAIELKNEKQIPKESDKKEKPEIKSEPETESETESESEPVHQSLEQTILKQKNTDGPMPSNDYMRYSLLK